MKKRMAFKRNHTKVIISFEMVLIIITFDKLTIILVRVNIEHVRQKTKIKNCL